MGFLDHSTNNIIVDAVLTDLGRRLLAENRGQFTIKKFSFSDDEVDYTTIQKYGRAVGKEKIVKNTPIFEAQTRENLALKYRMLTINDPTIVFLPALNLTLAGAATGQIDLTVGNSTTVSFEQKIGSGQSQVQVPAGLVDAEFVVIMSDRFLRLQSNQRPATIEPGNRNAYYIIPSDSNFTSEGGSKGSFVLQPKDGLDDSIFSVYSNANDPNKITTIVTIIGQSSGIRRDIVVNVSRITQSNA
jgi:hypothetical protein